MTTSRTSLTTRTAIALLCVGVLAMTGCSADGGAANEPPTSGDATASSGTPTSGRPTAAATSTTEADDGASAPADPCAAELALARALADAQAIYAAGSSLPDSVPALEAAADGIAAGADAIPELEADLEVLADFYRTLAQNGGAADNATVGAAAGAADATQHLAAYLARSCPEALDVIIASTNSG